MSAVSPAAAARAEEVLIAHQRHRGGCLCGYGELGRSHAGHQVTMLCEAGLPPHAEPSPWRFDVPEVRADVPAFSDAHGSIWVRTAGGWWRLIDEPADSMGKPLAWVLQYAPLVECEDPRSTRAGVEIGETP